MIQARLEDVVGGSAISGGVEKTASNRGMSGNAPLSQNSEPLKPEGYVYPPLRAPLPPNEQHRADALWMTKFKGSFDSASSLQDQGPTAGRADPKQGDALPACVAAIRLPSVPYQRRALPTKKPHGTPIKDEDKERSDASTDAFIQTDLASGRNETPVVGGENTEQPIPPKKGPPASHHALKGTTIMVHPLQLSEPLTSAAGKRLTKFLCQYTSERSKLELLRSSTTRNSGGSSKKESGMSSATLPEKDIVLLVSESMPKAETTESVVS
ncbi:unnamed protein product [Phytomonas sp. Hart1]|nr:unnamed protein product [Phytomonas sp. Hart1]|eukprot:CCW70179.1 unnamed protein product [Phytomonas sp. isolate Hart1]